MTDEITDLINCEEEQRLYAVYQEMVESFGETYSAHDVVHDFWFRWWRHKFDCPICRGVPGAKWKGPTDGMAR